MPMPRVSRSGRLGVLLIVSGYLYVVAVLLFTVWGLRYHRG